MSDNTPEDGLNEQLNESIGDATAVPPVPEVPEALAPTASNLTAQPVPEQPFDAAPLAPQYDVLADVEHPIGSSYDPMPLEVHRTDEQNWMGLVALITGIIALPVIAIVFGILGLNAVKKGKATNKGMSITGLVLAGVWIVLGAIVAGIVLFLVADSVNNSISSAQVGDCYVSTVVGTDTLEDASPVFGSCDTTSNSEVYFIGEYTGDVAPTDSGFTDELYTLCTTADAIAKVDTDIAANYYVEYYVANADDWDGGEHTVVCGLSTETTDALDPGAVTE